MDSRCESLADRVVQQRLSTADRVQISTSAGSNNPISPVLSTRLSGLLSGLRGASKRLPGRVEGGTRTARAQRAATMIAVEQHPVFPDDTRRKAGLSVGNLTQGI
jgi:hypothetical protein